ncbi:unnamed protein product [Closterium sp. NIES-54]
MTGSAQGALSRLQQKQQQEEVVGQIYPTRRHQHQQRQPQPQQQYGQVYPEEREAPQKQDRAVPARKEVAKSRARGSSRQREWKAKNLMRSSQRSQRRSPARYEGGSDQPDCFFSSCCCLMFVRRNRRPRSSCGSASIHSGPLSSTRRSQELAHEAFADDGAELALSGHGGTGTVAARNVSAVELLRAGSRNEGARGRGWVAGESDDDDDDANDDGVGDDGDYDGEEDEQPGKIEREQGSAESAENPGQADACVTQEFVVSSAATSFRNNATSASVEIPADVSDATDSRFPSAPRLPRGVSKETLVSLIRTAEEVGALRATESKDAAALLLAALEDISVPSVHRASSLGKISCSSGSGAAAAAAASAAEAAAAAAAAATAVTGRSRSPILGSGKVACFPGAGSCVVPRSLSADLLTTRSLELSHSLELRQFMEEQRAIVGDGLLILDRSMEMQHMAEMDPISMEQEYSPKRGGFDGSIEFAGSTAVNGRSMEFNRTFEIKRSAQPPVIAEPNSKPTAASARGSSSAPTRPAVPRQEPLSPLMLPSHLHESFAPTRLSLARDSLEESEGEETEDISVSRSNSSSNTSTGGGSCEGSGARCRAVAGPEGGTQRDAVRLGSDSGGGEESQSEEVTEVRQFVRSSRSVNAARGNEARVAINGASANLSRNMRNMNSPNNFNNFNRSAPLDFPSLPSMPAWPAPAKPRMASSVIVNARRRTFSRPHSPARAYSPRTLSPIASSTPTGSGLGDASGWAARRGMDAGSSADRGGEGSGSTHIVDPHGEVRRSYASLERSWSGDLGMRGGFNDSGVSLREKAWDGEQVGEEEDGWEMRQQHQSQQMQQQPQDVDEDLYYYHLWQQQHKQFQKLYVQEEDGVFQQQEQQVQYQRMQQEASRARDGVKRHWRP